jgi:hypothetical protein
MDHGLEKKISFLFKENENKSVELVRLKFMRLFLEVFETVFKKQNIFKLTLDG